MWTSRESWLTALRRWAADEVVFAAERQRVGVAITAPTLCAVAEVMAEHLSLIHISEPTRPRFGSRMPSSA